MEIEDALILRKEASGSGANAGETSETVIAPGKCGVKNRPGGHREIWVKQEQMRRANGAECVRIIPDAESSPFPPLPIKKELRKSPKNEFAQLAKAERRMAKAKAHRDAGKFAKTKNERGRVGEISITLK